MSSKVNRNQSIFLSLVQDLFFLDSTMMKTVKNGMLLMFVFVPAKMEANGSRGLLLVPYHRIVWADGPPSLPGRKALFILRTFLTIRQG